MQQEKYKKSVNCGESWGIRVKWKEERGKMGQFEVIEKSE